MIFKCDLYLMKNLEFLISNNLPFTQVQDGILAEGVPILYMLAQHRSKYQGIYHMKDQRNFMDWVLTFRWDRVRILSFYYALFFVVGMIYHP